MLSRTVIAESPAERLARLDIISQLDDRFRDSRYSYIGTNFYEQGCLPASIHNALMAVLGTPDTPGRDLLAELLVGLTPPFQRKTTGVLLEHLPDLLASPKEKSATADLTSCLKEIQLWYTLRDAEATLQAIQSLGSEGILLLERLPVHDSWEQLCDLILRLNAAGLGHARLGFASAAAGYGDLEEAPFGSGKYGHYVSLYLEVDEFCRSGTFYLLDSLPRALLYEPYGDGTPYQKLYPFTLRINDFKRFYTPERITPSIVKFSLHADQQGALDQLLNDQSLTESARLNRLIALHKRHMDTVYIIGVAQALLHIP